MTAQKAKADIRLDILIKKEQDHFSAHCLQFDLVATDDTFEGVQKAIFDICVAHIENSIANDNQEYMFSPAPKEVWAEYFSFMEDRKCRVKHESLPISVGKGSSFNIQEIACDA